MSPKYALGCFVLLLNKIFCYFIILMMIFVLFRSLLCHFFLKNSVEMVVAKVGYIFSWFKALILFKIFLLNFPGSCNLSRDDF